MACGHYGDRPDRSVVTWRFQCPEAPPAQGGGDLLEIFDLKFINGDHKPRAIGACHGSEMTNAVLQSSGLRNLLDFEALRGFLFVGTAGSMTISRHSRSARTASTRDDPAMS